MRRCDLSSNSQRRLTESSLWFGRDDHEVAAKQALVGCYIGNTNSGSLGIQQVCLGAVIAHPPVEGGLRVAAEGWVQGIEFFHNERSCEACYLDTLFRRRAIQAN